jgi:hypothetical protein
MLKCQNSDIYFLAAALSGQALRARRWHLKKLLIAVVPDLLAPHGFSLNEKYLLVCGQVQDFIGRNASYQIGNILGAPAISGTKCLYHPGIVNEGVCLLGVQGKLRCILPERP